MAASNLARAVALLCVGAALCVHMPRRPRRNMHRHRHSSSSRPRRCRKSEEWEPVGGKVSVARRSAQPANDKCLVFYHIPKSAGEALHAWAEYNGLKVWAHYGGFPKGMTFDDNSTLGSTCSPLGGRVQFSEARIYMGHFTPGVRETLLSEKMLGRKCEVATVLREPRNRTLSMLFYAHKGSIVPPFHKLSNPNAPGVVHPGYILWDRRWYFDEMCRQLGGLTPDWDMYMDNYTHNFSATCDVKQAKRTLSGMDHVGFLEEIDMFLEQVGVLLGVPLPEQVRIKRKNGSQNRGFEALDQGQQDLVTGANAGDIELYAWARETPLGKQR